MSDVLTPEQLAPALNGSGLEVVAGVLAANLTGQAHDRYQAYLAGQIEDVLVEAFCSACLLTREGWEDAVAEDEAYDLAKSLESNGGVRRNGAVT